MMKIFVSRNVTIFIKIGVLIKRSMKAIYFTRIFNGIY